MAERDTMKEKKITKEEVACIMRKMTSFYITEEMVSELKTDNPERVFAAHAEGDVTVLIKKGEYGSLEISHVAWPCKIN